MAARSARTSAGPTRSRTRPGPPAGPGGRGCRVGAPVGEVASRLHPVPGRREAGRRRNRLWHLVDREERAREDEQREDDESQDGGEDVVAFDPCGQRHDRPGVHQCDEGGHARDGERPPALGDTGDHQHGEEAGRGENRPHGDPGEVGNTELTHGQGRVQHRDVGALPAQQAHGGPHRFVGRDLHGVDGQDSGPDPCEVRVGAESGELGVVDLGADAATDREQEERRLGERVHDHRPPGAADPHPLVAHDVDDRQEVRRRRWPSAGDGRPGRGGRGVDRGHSIRLRPVSVKNTSSRLARRT